jgi:hypothetical protein
VGIEMRIVIELDPRVSEQEAEQLGGHLAELLTELKAYDKHVIVSVGVDS